MIAQSTVRHYVRVARHFTSTRATEVLALQASPILGCVLGGFSLDAWSLVRVGALLLGSLALTAHIFVFNDWAGYSSDIRDPRRATANLAQRGISRRQAALVASALLILASVALAAVGTLTVLLGAAIAILGVLYSCSSSFGKHTPVMGSVNHLIGGSLHFLLGYTLSHAPDVSGLAISLFFGLVFAGGHLNQEVRDYEGDLLNGIRTSAVVFGCRRVFVASLCTFTAAYAILFGLAALGTLPSLLLLSPIMWLLHVTWSMRAFRRGLGFDTALWMQQRYRLLYAVSGLMILVGHLSR